MFKDDIPSRRSAGGGGTSAWFAHVERLSFRARLLILLALLVVPVILAFGAMAIQRADNAQRVARHQAQMMLAAASVGFREALEGVRATLSVVAATEVVRADGPVGCGAALRRIAEQAGDRFSSLLLTDERGDIRCISSEGSGVQSVADWDSFRAAQSGAGFSITGLVKGPITGRWVAAASYPLIIGGSFRGAIIAGIQREQLSRAASSATLPRGGILALLDSAGNHLSFPSGRTGAWPSRLPRDGSAVEVTDVSGRAVLVAATALDSNLTLAISVPVGSLTRVSQELWVQGALMLVLLAALIGAIAVGFSMLVVEPIRALRNAVARTAVSGPGTAMQAAVPGAPIEIRILASAFERASTQIHERELRLIALATQREALLRELNHRVRNNLQIVSSLLRLQSRRASTAEARTALRTAEERVLALAILHRHLFTGPDPAHVDLHDFISAVSNEIFAALEDVPARDRVALVIDLPHQPVDADVAIPLALIVAEATANSLRHGYPAPRGGRIAISWSEANGRARFIFADDGVGLSAADLDPRSGLGRTLIDSFVRQLDGTAELRGERGCRLEVDFPWPRSKPNIP